MLMAVPPSLAMLLQLEEHGGLRSNRGPAADERKLIQTVAAAMFAVANDSCRHIANLRFYGVIRHLTISRVVTVPCVCHVAKLSVPC